MSAARTTRLAGAALAVLLSLGLAACETGTSDMSPGPEETVPGDPGRPADDLPEDTGEDEL